MFLFVFHIEVIRCFFFPLQIEYKANAGQMNFLRLLSKRVYQNITYSCYRETENDCTIQLQGANDLELKDSEKTKPSFLETDFKV